VRIGRFAGRCPRPQAVQEDPSARDAKMAAEDQAKVAVITGAAMGIGAAIAEQLARDGLTVLVCDIDAQEAGKTAARLRDAGMSAAALQMDVGAAASISAAFATIDATYGRCDVMVNNAGIAKTFPFVEFPLDNWLATLNINVTGTLLCSQHAARLMLRRRWGRIVNIASVAGMRAVGKGRTAYGTSKAAVIGLTRQMASELAGEGITANAVSPGPVGTPMTDVLHSPEFRAAYTGAIPMKRYGRPEEIASIVSYLASESAAYITGAVIPVDGGFMAAGALGA
jgi:NAD(P)-dependent dehydrogenase (short-subunit alcohol dehydrogenase family)